jgi:hypothetical protein
MVDEMSTTRHGSVHAEPGIGGAARAWATTDRAARLSLLWMFALMNYLYCDVLGLTDANILKDLINGTGPVSMTQGFLLGSAIVMEIPIAMVLLSVVLPFTPSRWASIAAGATMTLVQVASLFVGGGPTIYYAFFSAIEIAATAFIVWYAWTWHRADS